VRTYDLAGTSIYRGRAAFMSSPSDNGTRAAPSAPNPGAQQREPVPWHFKLVAVAVGVYVFLRIVQMLGWIGVTVKELHNALALLLIAFNGSIAVWGLLAWWRRWRLIQGFAVLAVLGWLLFLPQLLLGVALFGNGHRAPTGWQHYIYGLAAVIFIALGSFYRRRLPGREAMLYGLVAAMLTGIAFRGFLTGHG